MVFDSIKVDEQTMTAEGQLTENDSLVKITTADAAIGQYFNQLEMNDKAVGHLAIFKDEEQRFSADELRLHNLTVVGGNYRIELER